jgi:hypothetical protein
VGLRCILKCVFELSNARVCPTRNRAWKQLTTSIDRPLPIPEQKIKYERHRRQDPTRKATYRVAVLMICMFIVMNVRAVPKLYCGVVARWHVSVFDFIRVGRQRQSHDSRNKLRSGTAFPVIPPGGITPDNVASLPVAKVYRAGSYFYPGADLFTYAGYRQTTHRNIYRIPLE